MWLNSRKVNYKMRTSKHGKAHKHKGKRLKSSTNEINRIVATIMQWGKIVTCLERHVSEVVLSQQPIRNFFGNRLLEAYVRGNGYQLPWILTRYPPITDIEQKQEGGSRCFLHGTTVAAWEKLRNKFVRERSKTLKCSRAERQEVYQSSSIDTDTVRVGPRSSTASANLQKIVEASRWRDFKSMQIIMVLSEANKSSFQSELRL
jgi:hypothetical protein